MRVLFINLTRFGDLIQSQAAISDVARHGAEVGLVCLENFSGAATLLSNVAHVALFPSAILLSLLDSREEVTSRSKAGQEHRWAEALAELVVWKRSLETDFLPDVVCNLTPSLSARTLTRFLAGDKPCTGFYIDSYGFGRSGNGWGAFLQGASSVRGVSPYNVVDVFRKIAAESIATLSVPVDGKAVSVSNTAEAYISNDAAALNGPEALCSSGMYSFLTNQAPEGCKGFVGFQLGASADIRRWPVQKFVAVGARLWEEEGICPVLLGSPQEGTLALEYLSHAAHPALNLCGKTGFQELAAALTCMKLLVTNDTGTMHLAAGLNVPVLSLFLATAQPFDTGPYKHGSCSVEPDMDCHPCAFGTQCPNNERCRHMISETMITDLAVSFLRTGTWKYSQQAEAGSRVWTASHDKNTGRMTLHSLSGHEHDTRTLWMRILSDSIGQFLDRDITKDFSLDVSKVTHTLEATDKESIRLELIRLSQRILLLTQQGSVLLSHPSSVLKDKFMQSWARIQSDFSQSRWLSALSVVWLEETQADGKELPAILSVMKQFGELVEGICHNYLE